MGDPSTMRPATEALQLVTNEAPERFAGFGGTPRYEVIGCLGRGGMGVVYEAFDHQTRERIALKTLLHFDAASLYRFKQEFRTLADVLHPNLVHLRELVAAEHDAVFFTMELVEGTDFLGHVQKPESRRAGDQSDVVTIDTRARDGSRFLSEGGLACAPDGGSSAESPADFETLRPALRQLVEGVRALHNAGKLHRDLKPSNVRVTAEGRVVILDFGVATELRRSLRDGAEDEVVGTVAYMAPEQASGEAPLMASDWYSVGAMLYEAMVGRPPFAGDAIDVLTRKYTVAPPAPSACAIGVPDDLDALCMGLLAADPALRPGASEILRRLGATPSDRAAPRASDGRETAPPAGRDAQLAALFDAFEAARGGSSLAVRVSGLSGMGKSTVVNHFLDRLQDRDDVVILRGRAYERESVPYKAVDSVVDALTRHLLDMNPESAFALPKAIWALAHVFPVLRRVPSIDAIRHESIGDPQFVRQQAFGALRELFASLSKRQTVVVFIDDVQWGDNDSAALLMDLTRPPEAPPLLLIMTHRAEEEDTSPFLAEVRAHWPEDAEVRDITVRALEHDDAKRVALRFMGFDDVPARESADAIARESGGDPFLLEELARSASGYHRVASGAASSGPLSLDQMLGDRAARLPATARRLLEFIAIGGRPLPVATVAAAAGTEEAAVQLVALLRVRRFVRAGLRDGVEVVEAIHDRVRQAIVAQLDPAQSRDHHARLARELEARPDGDPEAIALHLLGAGDKERGAHYAERAAEQAVEKLAFAQAARLFQLTLETLSPDSLDAPRLRRRTAQAAEWAGLGERAASAYLAAAAGAPRLERVDLERAAASQLVAAGCVDEGAAIFRRVLAAVGRPLPNSIVGTLFWVIVYRVVSSFLGRARLVEPGPLPFADRVRLDALFAATRGLTVIDPISSMYVKARYLVDALRSGHRGHIVHAAASEAGTLASRGGAESKRERALFDLARRLSKEAGDDEGYSLYRVTYGISQYLRGHWKAALDTLDGACENLASARRWNANAHVYAVYCLEKLGDLREVRARTTRLLADATQRGDRYTTVNLCASHPVAVWIGANDIDRARRHLRESKAEWSHARFLVQHWQAMLWETEVELYAEEGLGSGGWDRLARDARPLRRSLLMSVQLIRALTAFVRGRAAIASAAGLADGDRAARLDEAARSARRLERESVPWTAPLSAILRAAVARATGDAAGAEACLQRAIEGAEANDMALYAGAARLQLGRLLGGERGEALVSQAGEAMRARGVRVPERYAQMLVPGSWTATG
jgi:serine/threonine protein kinase